MWVVLKIVFFCGEAAVVLATVKDARRRFAVAFGHP
jgi:hypothetical protein